jgi:uncharacterized LabA/DUF88 family protein
VADGGIVSATAGLFIDADNVDAEVITFAFNFLRERGLRVTVRRAYGGHERLGTVKDVCMAHGVKSLANHGRGTTDALLIVDAMDLLHGPDFPSVVAIASADADFAPLAIRLREAGCTTLCFAHSAKSDGDALKLAYDEVHFVDARVDARRAEPPPAKAPARRAAPIRAVPLEPPQQKADEAAPLERVLAKVPGLRDGDVVELNTVVALLRKENLLGKTGSGPKFLAKHAPYLRLTPESQPNKVRWVRR